MVKLLLVTSRLKEEGSGGGSGLVRAPASSMNFYSLNLLLITTARKVNGGRKR